MRKKTRFSLVGYLFFLWCLFLFVWGLFLLHGGMHMADGWHIIILASEYQDNFFALIRFLLLPHNEHFIPLHKVFYIGMHALFGPAPGLMAIITILSGIAYATVLYLFLNQYVRPICALVGSALAVLPGFYLEVYWWSFEMGLTHHLVFTTLMLFLLEKQIRDTRNLSFRFAIPIFLSTLGSLMFFGAGAINLILIPLFVMIRLLALKESLSLTKMIKKICLITAPFLLGAILYIVSFLIFAAPVITKKLHAFQFLPFIGCFFTGLISPFLIIIGYWDRTFLWILSPFFFLAGGYLWLRFHNHFYNQILSDNPEKQVLYRTHVSLMIYFIAFLLITFAIIAYARFPFGAAKFLSWSKYAALTSIVPATFIAVFIELLFTRWEFFKKQNTLKLTTFALIGFICLYSLPQALFHYNYSKDWRTAFYLNASGRTWFNLIRDVAKNQKNLALADVPIQFPGSFPLEQMLSKAWPVLMGWHDRQTSFFKPLTQSPLRNRFIRHLQKEIKLRHFYSSLAIVSQELPEPPRNELIPLCGSHFESLPETEAIEYRDNLLIMTNNKNQVILQWDFSDQPLAIPAHNRIALQIKVDSPTQKPIPLSLTIVFPENKKQKVRALAASGKSIAIDLAFLPGIFEKLPIQIILAFQTQTKNLLSVRNISLIEF